MSILVIVVFGRMCRRELDPIETYAALLKDYGVANPRGPFNKEARKLAGFTDEELAWLESLDKQSKKTL